MTSYSPATVGFGTHIQPVCLRKDGELTTYISDIVHKELIVCHWYRIFDSKML